MNGFADRRPTAEHICQNTRERSRTSDRRIRSPVRNPIAPHGQTSLTGFGPAALGSVDRCAIQLRHRDIFHTRGMVTFRMGLGPTASAVGVRCTIHYATGTRRHPESNRTYRGQSPAGFRSPCAAILPLMDSNQRPAGQSRVC